MTIGDLGILTDEPTVGVGGGGGGKLSNLFENKLFLQMLSAAGQDISAGEGVGKRLGAVTQQNIATQNYAKLLKKILSGEIEGGKMTMSDTGMKIDIPKSALDIGQELAIEGSQLPGGSGIDWAKEGSPFKGPKEAMDLVNPSASPLGNLSGADLAGLTPQDISQALQFKFTQEQFRQKKVSDLIDQVYKGALTEQALATAAKARRPVVPKDDRTAAIKNYEYAKLKEGYTGTFEDFQTMAETTHQRDYDEAVAGGYTGSFHEWLLELRKAGATRISLGEKLEEKKAFGELKGQLYFKDPKWSTDLSRHMSSEDVQEKIFEASATSPEAANLVRAQESVRFIESNIAGGGGSIEDVKLSEDGKTMIWTVKWPSGDVETIKHGIRP